LGEIFRKELHIFFHGACGEVYFELNSIHFLILLVEGDLELHIKIRLCLNGKKNGKEKKKVNKKRVKSEELKKQRKVNENK